jgi:hypothetical protein
VGGLAGVRMESSSSSEEEALPVVGRRERRPAFFLLGVDADVDVAAGGCGFVDGGGGSCCCGGRWDLGRPRRVGGLVGV